jgi:DNA-binding CsgD family transcriptional regulator
MSVARGYAVDDPGAPALWPWQRVLRGRVDAPELRDDSEPAARFRQLVAIAERLTTDAQQDGLLVVLEDLHWSDGASIRLLRHVANELGDARLAIVATYRSETDGPLSEMLPDLVRADPLVLDLGGLTRADVADLLRDNGTDNAELATRLHDATGGNPLLIRLVASDLADGARIDTLMSERPQLRRLVSSRVATLPPDVRAVVEAASVLGERITQSVLAAMTGRDEVAGELDAARRAGVLRGLAFEHALVRDAVYADLPMTTRVALHQAAAEALEDAARYVPGVIAGHWRRAERPDRCLQWAVRADDAARAALAFDDATRFAELAVSCAEQIGADTSENLIRLAEAQLLDGYAERSAQTCVAAAAAAERAGRVDQAASAALVVHGSGLPQVHRLVAPLCDRALAAVAPDDRAVRARLLAQRAIGAAEADGDPAAVGIAAEALAEAERSGDVDALLEAIAARHLVITVPATVAERLALGARTVDLATRAGKPLAELWGHLWRFDAAAQLGSLREMRHELAAVERLARVQGSLTARWNQLRREAMFAALLGDFAEARQANREAHAIGVHVGDISLIGLSFAFAAALTIVRGDLGELPPDHEQIFAHAPPIPLVRITRAQLHIVAGRLDEARAEFAEFRDIPRTFPVGVRWAPTMAQIGIVAVELDDTEVAAQVYDLLVGDAAYYQGDGSGGVFSRGSNSLLLGDLARTIGNHELAGRHYDHACAMNVRIGARPYTALARLGWAQSLLASGGNTTRARELVTSAQAEFERLDMPGPLRVAEGVVRALGAETSSPLSAREREVADLVSRSMSNRDIAAHLVLSERTVETHVRNILTKLGFTSRTEIVAWVLSAS